MVIESHRLQASDYGGYDAQGNWFWHGNFLPAPGEMTLFFKCPDGPTGEDWRYTTDNAPRDNCVPLDIQIDFATDWAANAVSPHRDGSHPGVPINQQDAFKWTWAGASPTEGKMVPLCELTLYQDGDTGEQYWVFGCTETRPIGYQGTNVQCDFGYSDWVPCNGINLNEIGTIDCTPDPTDEAYRLTGDELCRQSGIQHMLMEVTTPPSSCPGDVDCDGMPNETDPCPNDPMNMCPPPAGCAGDMDCDGQPDGTDPCPNDPVNMCAPTCGPNTGDDDCDGMPNETDPCPGDPGNVCPPPITIQPELGCENWMGPECVGVYAWTQMGSFDGTTWNWNSEFVDMMCMNHYSCPQNYPQYWTPVMIVDGVIEKHNIDTPRLDRRARPVSDGGNHTLVLVALESGDFIKYPEVWLNQNGNGQWIGAGYGNSGVYPDGLSQSHCTLDNPHAQCDGSFMPADGDPWNDVTPENADPCCRPYIDAMQFPRTETQNTSHIDESRINSVFWTQQNIFADPYTPDGAFYRFLKYNSDLRAWTFSGFEEQYGPNPRYIFPDVMAPIGTQTMRITYDGTKTYDLNPLVA